MHRAWKCDKNSMKTLGDFSDFIAELIAKHESAYAQSLEFYLRSLMRFVLEHKDQPVTPALLAQALSDAFAIEPLEFDLVWRVSSSVRFGWGFHSGRFQLKSLVGNEAKSLGTELSDFELLLAVLRFQIADLQEITPRSSVEAAISSSGNVWHNTSVFSNLECGIAGMISHTSREVALTYCDWSDLAVLLESGRLYE